MKKSNVGGIGLEMPKRHVSAGTTKKGDMSKDATIRKGLKKKYLTTKKACKVTFTLPGIAAGDAERVCIVGDFNNWDTQSNPMRRLRNGNYSIKLELDPGREYQFRYLIDGSRWENDWNADKYVKTPYGDNDNSVIVT